MPPAHIQRPSHWEIGRGIHFFVLTGWRREHIGLHRTDTRGRPTQMEYMRFTRSEARGTTDAPAGPRAGQPGVYEPAGLLTCRPVGQSASRRHRLAGLSAGRLVNLLACRMECGGLPPLSRRRLADLPAWRRVGLADVGKPSSLVSGKPPAPKNKPPAGIPAPPFQKGAFNQKNGALLLS